MPAKRDLDPVEIVDLLPYVWLCERDTERDTFVYKLAGAVISDTLDRPLRGRSLGQVFDAEWSARLNDRYRRVCEEPALYHGYGGVYAVSERYGVGERLILPLAGPNGQADHVLGLTYYVLTEKGSAPETVLSVGQVEKSKFLPLPLPRTAD